ncbi:unnamed protein product [Rotaria sp. Silwood1]|nr:unnamed protein product [Rotaria sp. Silwood1]CAF4891349.1 unnamed protein product [Rotaria sp. Silwood1]
MATSTEGLSFRCKRALIIGNNNYSQPESKLRHCINDANDLSKLLSAINFEVTTEPVTMSGIQQQPPVIPFQLIQQSDAYQTHTTTFTQSQIDSFTSKCRFFLLTLLRLTEKQAPEKLPIVRSCVQDLLNGTIDPETFAQRLGTLFTSQPHESLVPFFKLALPYMRCIVQNTFGRPITIELLERLHLPTSNKNNTNTT